MQQINLSDELFQDAQRCADAAGFANVHDFVSVILTHNLHDETPNLDQFFTPERLALIEKADKLIDAGEYFTPAQVDAELSQRRVAWLRQHPTSK